MDRYLINAFDLPHRAATLTANPRANISSDVDEEDDDIVA